ncbi:hypothetical protein JF634_05675 [Simonsiella muelleri]|uniref:Uncharacterized protein n=1 Tax=Simonsiella muelleri ATCC 29453 TaxID=641147 RepID=V9HJP5_9NEIS|nr:hypothetical protein [Simonsiella muelleri]AUX60829.1 hypothetical protein BWP33_02625 [Simonsiella muelleri ATCC 29453]AUX61890.1 hypothetical protein BWP33_08795 [Simonsiella muelleri ATCC 29453]AUX62247.1 hypothetical protein BWP33_10800 [Simonsiella muelleri ATCC 29453]EFG29756.1 hypothetical protein HMPREF9021_02416 [Simonsiella muelleri ATCC 29453]UBQ53977.1 hypothetical protein JF634_00160 [Simonsiella muelleri]
MIHKELRRATQRKDWDTVQKLENILNSKIDRRIKAETLLKIQQERKKMNYDMRLSFSQILFGAVGAMTALVAIIKNYLNK